MRIVGVSALSLIAICIGALTVAAQQREPGRQFDLIDVRIVIGIDPVNYSFSATAVNTIAPLADGLSVIRLDCGSRLKVDSVHVEGAHAIYSRSGDTLWIKPASPLLRGKPQRVSVHYSSGDSTEGFHWIKPTPQDSTREGFWTVGQPMHNHGWLPTWDYPNDLATSEARVTVPAGWYVIGNGALVSDSLSRDRRTRTFTWRMRQPHATYLLSLAGGRLDVKSLVHEGIPLMYVVQAGKKNMIDRSFEKTPEMVSYYSKLLGVKYPWPKYSQAALPDYAGGIENVSATSFGPGILADRRDSPDGGDALIAHELAHQWFGDLVTYRQWGDVWLGEGFATYFGQLLYDEHWHSKVSYAHHVDDMMQQYFSEASRYVRPLSVPNYSSAEAMFDDHAYLKGAVLLHVLRRRLGDEIFFRSVHHYLTKFRNRPVDSHDLRDALSEGSGVDLRPFFSDWIFKPGHPVLDYTWSWDSTRHQVVLRIRQLQDTARGIPIYSLTPLVAVITDGQVARKRVVAGGPDELIRIPLARKPDALILDPDHNILREIPTLRWSSDELSHIVRFAPSPVDRQEALNRIVAGNPSDSVLTLVEAVIAADDGGDPVFRSLDALGELARPELRGLFRKLLSSSSFERRAQAVRALGHLESEPGDITMLRSLVNDNETYAVVRSVIRVLGDWDPAGNRDLFERVGEIISPFDAIRALSLDALAKADSVSGKPAKDADPDLTEGISQFMQVLARGDTLSPLLTRRQRAQLRPGGNKTVASWLGEMKSFTPLKCDHVEKRQIVQNNEAITTICFYRLSRSASRPLLIKFSLNAEKKVAYWANYPPNY